MADSIRIHSNDRLTRTDEGFAYTDSYGETWGFVSAETFELWATNEGMILETAVTDFLYPDTLPPVYDFGITTLDGVVESINNSPVQGFEDITPEWKAMSYVVRGQQESGYPIDEDSVEAHLDILVESGAEFEYPRAMQMALTYSEKGE